MVSKSVRKMRLLRKIYLALILHLLLIVGYQIF
jgi:hypothetical protein